MIQAKSTETHKSTNVRINIELLDKLMNLAGELVLSRNQLVQAVSVEDLKTLHLTSQRIDLVTSELQEGIMKTRMQPIANIFNTFPQIIRDTATAQKKRVELTVNGQEVELDKTIIESIADHLTKLARFAVTAGLESTPIRQQNQKPEIGQLNLNAYHEAGQVSIEISDDGRGLNPDDLGAVAAEKGLVNASQLEAMSAKEKLQLILLPGFPIERVVQNESDADLALDGVKAELDRLGGVIDITSRVGQGTTFHIKLPLTMAIIPSQIVSVSGERYAIPQINLDELLRIPAAKVKDKIEMVGDAAVIRLRGKLLPLLRVADLLGIQRNYTDPHDAAPKPDRRMNVADRRSTHIDIEELNKPHNDPPEQLNETENRSGSDRRYHASGSLNIAVVSAGALTYGLIVDEMHDPEEIVVKPLGRHLSDCSVYAGATIMGDGRVALILDLYNLAKQARFGQADQHIRAAQSEKSLSPDAIDNCKTRWLCFRIAEDEHFAIAMEAVQRIARVKNDAIEEVGGKQVIQHRGNSLPLLSLDRIATIKPRKEMAFTEVITIRVEGREVGLLATPPVDTVEMFIDIDSSTLRQACLRGSAIMRDKTTLIVDVEAAVKSAFPEWFNSHQAA
jgi:two-component system chemotaxis sensor kinase CheA